MTAAEPEYACTICDRSAPHVHTLAEKILGAARYAFVELVQDTGKWLLLGIGIGGAIAFFVPSEFIDRFLSSSLVSYPLMLLLGVPMYVCATASIPIAASLVAKGMSPGAGLIFLIVGPATNTATLSFVAGKLGKKSLFVYLLSICITAIVFGLGIDYLWRQYGESVNLAATGTEMMPVWFKTLSGIVLLALIANSIARTLFQKRGEVTGMGMVFTVENMTCEHCVKTITRVAREIPGVDDVHIDLKRKKGRGDRHPPTARRRDRRNPRCRLRRG